MSLKAKIEAVIYASEEPVTLAQLVSLLGEEGQAELDALASQQTSLDLPMEQGGDTAASAEGAGDVAGLEPEPEAAAEEHPQPEAAAPSEAVAETPGDGAEATTAVEPAADEGKKAARLRERALREHFRLLLDGLVADYANGDRGLEIREVAGGFRLATKPEYHDAVRGFVKSLKPPLKLSLQALETLAVVAYKQPVTAPEVSEIRGVDSGGVLAGLMTRKLVATAGRKAVIGRPILYKTTKDFLVRFGLKDINELPSIEEFEKMAGELAGDGSMQEEIPMESAPHGNRSEESPEGGGSALNELNSALEGSGVLHETPEEMESDRSTEPAGTGHEPAEDVERMRGVHEAQADGIPAADESVEGQESHANAEESAG